jgi:hypothetical protein
MSRRTQPRHTPPQRYVEYKEAEGRTVQSLRYWHSPENGQAVSIQFTDGTRVHIGIGSLLKVKTEIGALRNGDLKIDKTYPTIVGSPVRY